MNRKYVAYILIDPRDRSVFYVGIGRAGQRPQAHLNSVLTGQNMTNGWKVSIIRDILAAGMEPEYAILEWFDEYEDACEYEIAAIAACREAGIGICNIHPGGLFVRRKPKAIDQIGVAKRAAQRM